ncbi:MAG: hypothetical protein J7647_12230 [Cyanobacteria bacterium SBLK]|nr:hypothetical protein [Cyanobacteria bacterium SBLK]
MRLHDGFNRFAAFSTLSDRSVSVPAKLSIQIAKNAGGCSIQDDPNSPLTLIAIAIAPLYFLHHLHTPSSSQAIATDFTPPSSARSLLVPNKTGMISTSRKQPPRTMINFDLFPGVLSEIFVSATQSQTLSPSICQSLKAAANGNSFNEEEKAIAKRLLWAVRKGKIQVIA